MKASYAQSYLAYSRFCMASSSEKLNEHQLSYFIMFFTRILNEIRIELSLMLSLLLQSLYIPMSLLSPPRVNDDKFNFA